MCEGLNSRSVLHALTRMSPPASRNGTASRLKPESLSVRTRPRAPRQEDRALVAHRQSAALTWRRRMDRHHPWAPMGESAKWPSGWPFKPDNLAGSSPVSPAITHLELRAAEASVLTRVCAGSSPARCTNLSVWGSGRPPVSGTGSRKFESCRADQEGIVQWQDLSLPS